MTSCTSPTWTHLLRHCSVHHCPFQYSPIPRPPAPCCAIAIGYLQKETPLWEFKKVSQIHKSSLFPWTAKYNGEIFLLHPLPYTVCMQQKALPATTTLQTKVRCPNKPCSSFSITFFLAYAAAIESHNHCNFPTGNLDSALTVSNSMPKMVRIVTLDPQLFPVLTGYLAPVTSS